MTRKDFELLARAVRFARGVDRASRTALAVALADAIAGANPRFDRVRFLAACEVPPCIGCQRQTAQRTDFTDTV